MTSTIWGVQDFVIEYGKVERKTKADRVRGSQLSLRNVRSILFAVSGFFKTRE